MRKGMLAIISVALVAAIISVALLPTAQGYWSRQGNIQSIDSGIVSYISFLDSEGTTYMSALSVWAGDVELGSMDTAHQLTDDVEIVRIEVGVILPRAFVAPSGTADLESWYYVPYFNENFGLTLYITDRISSEPYGIPAGTFRTYFAGNDVHRPIGALPFTLTVSQFLDFPDLDVVSRTLAAGGTYVPANNYILFTFILDLQYSGYLSDEAGNRMTLMASLSHWSQNLPQGWWTT